MGDPEPHIFEKVTSTTASSNEMQQVKMIECFSDMVLVLHNNNNVTTTAAWNYWKQACILYKTQL